MARQYLAVALALCVALQAGASRVPNPNADNVRSFQDVLFSRLGRAGIKVQDDPNRKRIEEENPAYLTIRFVVPPSRKEDFIDEWHKLEDEVENNKQNVIFALKKTSTDNVIFYSYEEWETGRDLMDHFESKAFDKFKMSTIDMDVTWEVMPLKTVTDTSEERREMRRGRTAAPNKRKEYEGEVAHVLTKYVVPPSQVEDFIDSWQDLAEDVWDEEDNMVYSLRKIATTNNEFMSYGTWEDFNAFMDHVHSKHVRRFHSTIADQGIVYYLSPLEKHDSMKD